MTAQSRFEQSITELLRAEAVGSAPADILANALESVATTHQDRYLTQRLFGDGVGRSPALRWAIVLLLVGLAVAASTAVVGGRLPQFIPGGTGAFLPGPALLTGRGEHTTTLLPDGGVLVVGGETYPGIPVPRDNSAELWDGAAGSGFVQARPLGEDRTMHTASLLPDGRVLIVGGWTWSEAGGEATRSSAEVWDPSTREFHPAGELTDARLDHTATVLPDGRVLIAGGRRSLGDDPPLSSLEIWDPATSTFSAAGELSAGLTAHIALLLGDGRVLFVGGSETELWDPATGATTPGPSQIEPRYFHAATLLRDGVVLVTGGMWGSNEDIVVRSTAELWDPATDSFVLVGPMLAARAGHTATLLPDGRVLIANGDDPATAEIFDPRTSTFAATGAPIEGRNGSATATLLSDDRVLIVGTMSRFGITPSTEVWDANAPAAAPREPTARPTGTPRPEPAASGD